MGRNSTQLLVALAAAATAAALIIAAPAAQAARVGETGSRVVELSQHRRSGVISARLECGANLHVRNMADGQGRVALAVSMFGGELLETADNRGVTRLATLALASALDSHVNEPNGEPGAKITVNTFAVADGVQIRATGTLSGVRRAAEEIQATLASPALSDEAVERARRVLLDQLERGASDSRLRVSEALTDLVFAEAGAKARAPTPGVVKTIGAQDVSTWWERHAAQLPLEIGVAGDVSIDQAIELAALVLKGARTEPRRSDSALVFARRSLAPAPGPLARTIVVEGHGAEPADTANVVVGFCGIDLSRLNEFRALRVASRLLDQRVRGRLENGNREVVANRPELQQHGAGQPEERERRDRSLRAGCSVVFSPYRDMGMLVVSATTASEQATATADAIAAEIARLATEAPGGEEFRAAVDRLARQSSVSEKDAEFWAQILSRAAFSGAPLEGFGDAESAYRTMTPDDVQGVVARYWQAERRVRLIVNNATNAKLAPEQPISPLKQGP